MRKSVRKTSISFKNAKVSPGPSRNTSVHSNVNVSGKRNRTRSILSSQSSNSIRRPSIFRRQTTQQQQNWNFNPNRVVSVTSLNNIAGDNSRKLAARRVYENYKQTQYIKCKNIYPAKKLMIVNTFVTVQPVRRVVRNVLLSSCSGTTLLQSFLAHCFSDTATSFTFLRKFYFLLWSHY